MRKDARRIEQLIIHINDPATHNECMNITREERKKESERETEKEPVLIYFIGTEMDSFLLQVFIQRD